MKKLHAKHKAFIKTQPCVVCGRPADPHHLERKGIGGKNKSGIKDFSCIPFCRKHHSELEQIGKSRFENKYGIDLWAIALKFLIIGHVGFADEHNIDICKETFKLLRGFILREEKENAEANTRS